MKISILISFPDSVRVQYRFENEGVVGDGAVEVHPGESFLGVPFLRLMELGNGSYEIDDIKEEK